MLILAVLIVHENFETFSETKAFYRTDSLSVVMHPRRDNLCFVKSITLIMRGI